MAKLIWNKDTTLSWPTETNETFFNEKKTDKLWKNESTKT